MCSLWGSIFWQHLTYVITPCKTEFGAYLHIESSLGADIDLESCASSYLLAPRTTQSLQWSLSCMPFSGGASQPSVLAAQYARAFASPVQLAATSFSPKNTRTDLKQEPKFCLFPPFYMCRNLHLWRNTVRPHTCLLLHYPAYPPHLFFILTRKTPAARQDPPL